MNRYEVIMEDATAYLPHDPTGVEYKFYVYDNHNTYNCTFTKKIKKNLVFSGNRQECQSYVERF